jgi:hypothetical protein
MKKKLHQNHEAQIDFVGFEYENSKCFVTDATGEPYK